MIFDLVWGIFSTLIDGFISLLPVYDPITPNGGGGWINDFTHYLWSIDAVIPVKSQILFIGMLITLGVLMVPFMFFVWLWSVIFP